MQIDGSTILLTGASGGLGEAIARRVEVLDALAAELGDRVSVERADLADPADVERLSARAATCDALVANAGIGQDPPLDQLAEADIDRALAVNLRAPMVMAVSFAQAKQVAGAPGRIVLVGSLAGLAPSPGTELYNATKFGLRGFALSLAQDLAGTGVSCTLVAPGFIRDAGMFHDGGIDLPPGVRTKAPADVAAGVAKAIADGPTEVYVSPAELRVAATLGTVAPGLAAFVQRKLGVDRIIEERDA